MSASSRSSKDDFFCFKYRVWYGLRDCVFRHHHRTTAVCASCEQGAANERLIGPPEPTPRWVRLPALEALPGSDEEGA